MPVPNTQRPRLDLAEGIRQDVAKTGWQVYSSPPDVFKLPAFVVDYGSPVVEPETLDVRLRFHLTVTVLTTRTLVEEGYVTHEGVWWDLLSAIGIGTQFKFMQVDTAPEQIEAGGQEVFRSVVAFDAIMS